MTFIFGSGWLQKCKHKTSYKFFSWISPVRSWYLLPICCATMVIWAESDSISYLLCFCSKAPLHNHRQALLDRDRELRSLKLEMFYCTVSESSKHHWLPSSLPRHSSRMVCGPSLHKATNPQICKSTKQQKMWVKATVLKRQKFETFFAEKKKKLPRDISIPLSQHMF